MGTNDNLYRRPATDTASRAVLLDSAYVEAGRHKTRIDGAGLASDVYVLRLRAAGQTRTQKLTVVK